MPYPNEHAARQRDPDEYDRFTRTTPTAWPRGAEAIWGIKGSGRSLVVELQSVRFDRRYWTPERARRWLDVRGMKTVIEEATG